MKNLLPIFICLSITGPSLAQEDTVEGPIVTPPNELCEKSGYSQDRMDQCYDPFVQEFDDMVLVTGRSQPGSVLNANNKPRVELYTTSENSTVGIYYDYQKASSKFSFGFTVPSEKEGDTTLINLDGLAKYNVLKLGYQSTIFNSPSSSITSLHDNCKNLRTLIGETSDGEGCSVEDLILKHGPSGKYINKLRKLKSDVWGGGVWTYGFEGEIGTKKFSYLPNVESDTPISEDKEAWSLGAYIAYYDTFNYAFSLKYKRENLYKSSESVILCKELNTPCLSGPLGEPVKEESDILDIEFRKLFENGNAVTLKVSHNLDTNNTQIELPVYLFEAKTKGYSGGLAFGWNESDPGVTVGLFVGQSFGL